ncbi:hypothetical protein BVG19_g4504 [[Candida] boidinii]|nr:hypothetical protein BVG19_g4504 [[Candida] boidinii]OWB49230.1 nucleic acid binding protein [[Candida] boidinii]
MKKGKEKTSQESKEVVIQQSNNSDNIDRSSSEIGNENENENGNERKTITIKEIKETYNVPEILIKSLFKFDNNTTDKEVGQSNENNSSSRTTNNSNNLVNDKKFILNLEQEILEFLKNSSIDSWKLVPLNSYYRLLTHKLSEYYNLGHILSNNGYSMVLFKINTSLINADSEIKKLASFDKNGNIKPLNYRNLRLNLNEKLNKYKLFELVKELELKYPSIKIEDDDNSGNNTETSGDNTNIKFETDSNTDTVIGMSDLSEKQFPKLKKSNKAFNINKESSQAREELYLKINQKIKNTKTILSDNNSNNNSNNVNIQNSFDQSYEENPQYSKYRNNNNNNNNNNNKNNNYNKKFTIKNKNKKLNNYNTNPQFNQYYPGYGDPNEYMMPYTYYYYPQQMVPDDALAYEYQEQLPTEEGQESQIDFISKEIDDDMNGNEGDDGNNKGVDNEEDSAEKESDDIKDTERTNDDNNESNSITNSYFKNVENAPMFQPMMTGGGSYYSPQQQHQFPGGLYPGPPPTHSQLESQIPQALQQQPSPHLAASGYPQMMMFPPGPMTQPIPGSGMDGISTAANSSQQYQYYNKSNTYNPKSRNSVNYNRISKKKNSPTASPLEVQQGSPSQKSYFKSLQQGSNASSPSSALKSRKNLSNDKQYSNYHLSNNNNRSYNQYNINFQGTPEEGLGNTDMYVPSNMNMHMNIPVNMNMNMGMNMGMPMNMPMNMNSRMVPYPYQIPMPLPVPTPHLPHPDLLHKPQYYNTDPLNNITTTNNNNDQIPTAGFQSAPSSPLLPGNNDLTQHSRRSSTHKPDTTVGTDNVNNGNRNNQGNNSTGRGSSRMNSVSNVNIKFAPGSSVSASTQTKSPIQHLASVTSSPFSSAPSSAPRTFSATSSTSSSSTPFNKGKPISSTSKNYSYLPEEYISKNFDGAGVELNNAKSVNNNNISYNNTNKNNNKLQNTKHNKSVLENLTKKISKVTI